MFEGTNWNQALTLGAYIVIAFWLALQPTTWLYGQLRHWVPNKWFRCLFAVTSLMLCVFGASLALGLLGIVGALGLKLLGIKQGVIH